MPPSGPKLHSFAQFYPGFTPPEARRKVICLCWRCHAEAHGTAIPERHTYHGGGWEGRQTLADEYEQACTEYVCDYYASMGIIADPVHGGGR